MARKVDPKVLETLSGVSALAALGIGYEIIDGDIVVMDRIDLSGRGLTRLPDLSGIVVIGDFLCNGNKLESLAGCPFHISRNFDCSANQLQTLQGGPCGVGGKYACRANRLVALAGAPVRIGGYFDCEDNDLVSLEKAPRSIGADFYCGCNPVATLEGGPSDVGGDYRCEHTEIATLRGMPDRVGSIYCRWTKISSLVGLPDSFREVVADFGIFSRWSQIPARMFFGRAAVQKLEDRLSVPPVPGIAEQLSACDPVSGKSFLDMAVMLGRFGDVRNHLLAASEKLPVSAFSQRMLDTVAERHQLALLIEPRLFSGGVHDVMSLWDAVPEEAKTEELQELVQPIAMASAAAGARKVRRPYRPDVPTLRR